AAPKSYVDSAISATGASLWASSTAGTYNVGLGNVGIGTTNPGATLDAVQATQGNIALRAGMSGNPNLIVGTATGFTNLVIANGDYNVIFNTRTNGGASAERFRIGGGSLIDNVSVSNSNLVVNTNQLYVQQSSGSVGIGTTNPGYKLEVSGNIRSLGASNTIDASVDSSNVLRMLHSGSYGSIQSFVGGGYSTLVLNKDGGNVGIGTTTPIYKLDVNGSGNFNSNLVHGVGTPLTATDAVPKSYLDSAFSGSGAYLWASSTAGTYNVNPGNVGIGITNPQSKLAVNGNTIINGESGSWSEGLRINLAPNNYAGVYMGGAAGSTAGTGVGVWTFQRNASGDFAIYENNVQSSGLYIKSGGNVGIGTATPQYKLDVRSATASYFDQAVFVGSPTAGSHAATKNYVDSAVSGSGAYLWASSTAGTYNVGSGNVGIGTTNPGALLHIVTTGSANNLKLDSTGAGSVTGLSLATDGVIKGYWATPRSNGQYFLDASAGDMVFRSESNKILFGQGTGNSTMTINGSNVGIGTTNPGTLLHVSGASTAELDTLRLENTSTGNAVGKGVNLSFRGIDTVGTKKEIGRISILSEDGGNYVGGAMVFSNMLNGSPWTLTEKMRITGGGNVGIGLTNPSAKLTVKTATQYDGIMLNNGTNNVGFITGLSATNDTGQLTLLDGGTAKIQFNAGLANSYINYGNLGIATTTPAYKLDVVGAGNFNANQIHGVGTPTFAADAAPKSYVDSALSATGASLWASSTVGTYNVGLGNVGVGTTAPGEKLEINGNIYASNGFLAVSAGSGAAYESKLSTAYNFPYMDTYLDSIAGASYEGRLHFRTNSGGGSLSDKMVITNQGNVGIGTSNPSSPLDVVGDIEFGSSTDRFILGSNSSYPSRLSMTFPGGNSLLFYDGGNNEIMWNSSIGLNYNFSPGGRLVKFGDGTDVWIEGTGGDYGKNLKLDILSSVARIFSTDFDLALQSGSTKNVGIGTTAPLYKLDVAGSGSFNSNIIHGVGTPLASDDATPKSYVDSAVSSSGASLWASSTAGTFNVGLGNVGIGTTAPNRELEVSGISSGSSNILNSLANFTDTSSMAAGVGGGITFSGNFTGTTNTSAAGIKALKTNGTANNWSFDLGFYTRNTGSSDLSEVMRINNLGNVGIGKTNPSKALDVVGDINASVTVNATSLCIAGDCKTDWTSFVPMSGSVTLTGPLTIPGVSITTSALAMNNNNVTGVNKLTANVIDPLYSINGKKYSTFALSVAGGLKEEYVGKAQLNTKNKLSGEFETTIDFSNLEQGSDLWVWRKVIEFNKNSVEVLVTPYGQLAQVYYVISGDKLIFRSDKPVEISYRLIAKRFDAASWPTLAHDQTEKTSLIIKD
ncbi:MAG: hypothetical protein WCK59_04040, partial [Candidatus Falkowbacteria bacterium]